MSEELERKVDLAIERLTSSGKLSTDRNSVSDWYYRSKSSFGFASAPVLGCLTVLVREVWDSQVPMWIVRDGSGSVYWECDDAHYIADALSCEFDNEVEALVAALGLAS